MRHSFPFLPSSPAPDLPSPPATPRPSLLSSSHFHRGGRGPGEMRSDAPPPTALSDSPPPTPPRLMVASSSNRGPIVFLPLPLIQVGGMDLFCVGERLRELPRPPLPDPFPVHPRPEVPNSPVPALLVVHSSVSCCCPAQQDLLACWSGAGGPCSASLILCS